MSYRNIAATVVGCIVLGSCSQLTMEDVSSTPEYSSVIGATFRAREDVWAIGITTDKNYKKIVSYVVLVPGVGFAGPEVVTKERVVKGFAFRVIRVIKASNFGSSKVAYVIQDAGSDKFKGTEVRVTQTGQVNDRNFGLDQQAFERTK